MVAVEVPQTLEYRGGQLNVAPVLEVEKNNWKKMFMYHIIGIEPQFENIISNGPYIPMVAGQRKPETQWTPEERKAANLDQRLKSLIMSMLLDDQMNSVINCLTAKSTWDDLILYHEGPFDVKESRVMDLKNTNHVKDSELASLFGKLKYEENLIDSIYETKKSKFLVSATPLSTVFFSTSIVQDFQDSPDDEEDTRSSREYINDLEEEYQARALLAKSKRFFKKGTQRLSGTKATDQTGCHKCGRKGHSARDFKALMALADEERVSICKESVSNGEWVKICIQKAHTLLEMDEKEVSSNDNEVTEAKALMALTDEERVSVRKISDNNVEMGQDFYSKAWLNNSNKVNQCISEQIPTQKNKILGIDQLNEDTSSSGLKDLMFIKSLVDNSEMSISDSNKPKLSGAEDFTLSNHDTSNVPLTESQRNKTDHSVVVSDASVTDYDLADKSSVYSTPLPPLEKLTGAEPVSGPKTIKSILKSKSTFKAETLKGITINEPSSAPVRGNKSSSLKKTYYRLMLVKKREALQAKKVEFFKASKTESSSALRSKTPTKRNPDCFSSSAELVRPFTRNNIGESLTLRDTSFDNPKRYWEILPKEFWEITTQRILGDIPKEYILGYITQKILGDI
ncbi:hypothetical protein Tco_1252896 [Tanacetum coccineum]